MTQSPPAGTLRSGQFAIVTIALVGFAFFGGMELLKWRLHTDPITPIASVVVLPAQVIGSSDFNYLTDAVARTLSILLTQVQGLDTKAPPSSVDVDRVQGDVTKIANAYQVPAVLLSVVTVQQDSLTLSLQLVSPGTHAVLWSNLYAGQLNNYTDLILRAADGAGHVLQPTSSRVTSTSGLAANSAAELAFRQGEHSFMQYDSRHLTSDFNAAAAAFEHALQLDRTLADAAADIALLHNSRSNVSESERRAGDALRIKPTSGRGNHAMALVMESRGQPVEAVGFALTAARAEPQDPFAQSALEILGFASLDLRLAVDREVQRLAPLHLRGDTPGSIPYPPPADELDQVVGMLKRAQIQGELPKYLEKPLAELLIQGSVKKTASPTADSPH